MKNKRGQGLSTETIIIIILAVAVLVILIVGFSIGWDKLKPRLSSDNVDTVVSLCNSACSTQSNYEYCIKAIELKAEGLPDGKKSVKGNCSFFATNPDYEKYKIKDCPEITC